ncbi:RNA polymerase sigma-70 factor [Pseudoflavitalea sp. G-6-1-2]|uniref:RNA polymerase sigma factor n=1 Tax=Pseudoflavitalea sp. G-6-1-2 TaxID=2728841 RepID=UPI00146ABC3D|nr:RNA polymerase sigma-70 factor [Pseudoflavitalea sp. G-6-1-2]NML21485.1 RNA polymerase sigma-70 factor [Pseudoflavitalea sp. G-6-1-2]
MDTHNQNNELLTLISQSDEKAFRELFDQYSQLIFSFAYHLTDSDIIAKDVVQEIFIRIWTNRHTLDQIVNIRAWILRLTRNHVLNGLKRKAHETMLLREIKAGLTEDHHPTDEAIQYRELETLLQQAIAQLPPQQQKVYQLSRNAGMKHDEIATALNISPETVKKHIMAALLSIRKYLEKREQLPPRMFAIFF